MAKAVQLEQEHAGPAGILLRIAVVVAILAAAWGAYRLFASSAERIGDEPQRVALIEQDLPPPEPEPVLEEFEFEEDLSEFEQYTETGDDTPAAMDDMLGLDTEGSAGADMFGLRAKKGGRDILHDVTGGGGGGAASAAFRRYAQRLAAVVRNTLSRREELRRSAYTLTVKLWLDDEGHVLRHVLNGSTGKAELDGLLDRELDTLPLVEGRLPAGLPQPITLRIVVRHPTRES